MPLVSITCKGKYYPTLGSDGKATYTPEKQIVADVAAKLIKFISERVEELGLDPKTTSAAIQTDLKEFHYLAENAPDIWIHIQLTEPYDPARANEVISLIAANISAAINDSVYKTSPWTFMPKWALDVFWGPGHGCMAKDGEIDSRW